MKFLRIFLIINLSLLFLGCGKTEVINNKNIIEDKSQNIMIGNPIKKSSQEEIENLFGFKFNNLSEFEDLSFSTINTEELIGQVNFKFEGKEFCFRCKKTEEIEPLDISGLYYEWGSNC